MPAHGSDDEVGRNEGHAAGEADAAAAGGDPDSLIGLCVKWESGGGYGFLCTEGKPDAFVHSTGLDDLAADKLSVGDEVRYIMVDGNHGAVAKVTELLRSGVKVPDDYRPLRKPAEVGSHDKHTGYLISWHDGRQFGLLEMRNGTTVLITARELRGGPIDIGDKVKFELIEGRNGKPKATNVTVIERPKGGKGRGKKGGGKAKGKGGFEPRRRRRRSLSSSEEKVIKKVKKEMKPEPEEDAQDQDEDAINAAADASAALAVMTAFRTRAHPTIGRGTRGKQYRPTPLGALGAGTECSAHSVPAQRANVALQDPVCQLCAWNSSPLPHLQL
eukprot:gene3516-biopygen264